MLLHMLLHMLKSCRSLLYTALCAAAAAAAAAALYSKAGPYLQASSRCRLHDPCICKAGRMETTLHMKQCTSEPLSRGFFTSSSEPCAHTCNSFTYGPARSTVRLLQTDNRTQNLWNKAIHLLQDAQCRSPPCHRRLYCFLALNLSLMTGTFRPSCKRLIDV